MKTGLWGNPGRLVSLLRGTYFWFRARSASLIQDQGFQAIILSRLSARKSIKCGQRWPGRQAFQVSPASSMLLQGAWSHSHAIQIPRPGLRVRGRGRMVWEYYWAFRPIRYLINRVIGLNIYWTVMVRSPLLYIREITEFLFFSSFVPTFPAWRIFLTPTPPHPQIGNHLQPGTDGFLFLSKF